MVRPAVMWVAVLVALPIGCGGMMPEDMATEAAPGRFVESTGEVMMDLPPPMAAPGQEGRAEGGPEGGAEASPPDGAIRRRIIYDAQIDLIIEDIDPAADRLAALVEQHRGYVAEQDLAGSPGDRRSGRWKVRVPVEGFEGFVAGVMELGELERNHRTSQDVTEQFYDVEARVRNKRVEEQTLTKILEERSGELEDVLKVEVELSRVRGEIEQLEGRLRVLDNLSSLATVTINLKERVDYEPAAPVAPTFRERVARAWEESVRGLRQLGESLVLWLVGVAPWLPLIVVGVLVLRWLVRWLYRVGPRVWAVIDRPIGGPRPPAP